MAGDWLAIQKDLPHRIEVMRIVDATGWPRHAVVGLLVEFWAWADGETIDGTLPGITVDSLTTNWRHLGDTQATFWRTLVSIGWLVESPGGLLIPKFERWMGASAKRRLQKNLSKQKGRALKGALTPQNGDSLTTSDVVISDPTCRPEKRREEKSNTYPPTPLSGGLVSGEGNPPETTTKTTSEPGRASIPAPRDGYQPPGQTLEQIHATPQPRRETLSDNPELLPIVLRILSHYASVCAPCPASKTQAARAAVCARLMRSQSEQTLCAAATRYAEHCRASDTKRQSAQTFYGDEGSADEFLAAPPPTVKPCAAIPPPRKLN